MPVLLAGAVWAGLVAWLILRMLRQFRAYRMIALEPAEGAIGAVADVSVIVPIRNEVDNIGPLLRSLIAQHGFGARLSIVAVDDDSQDGSARALTAAAGTDSRIVPVAAGRLPTGWMGKPHACWQGALRAPGEWLCFIDADVRAAPELVAAALAAAARRRLDMLSVYPRQELGSFWERVILPAGLVLIACVKDLRRADDPQSNEVAANGQFLLIRRAAYFAVGGHAAVRGEVCEDKALAERVKRAGLRFGVFSGERLARTRMYTRLAELWEGLGKNATEIIGDAPRTVMAATAALLAAWIAVALPPLGLSLALAQHSAVAWAGFGLALLGSLAAIGVQLGTARHFRIPFGYGLLFPLAYTMIAALAWHSALLRRRGRVRWKGRTYELGPAVLPERR